MAAQFPDPCGLRLQRRTNLDEVVRVVADRQGEHNHHQHVAVKRSAVGDRLDCCHDGERGTNRHDGNHHHGRVGQLGSWRTPFHKGHVREFSGRRNLHYAAFEPLQYT